MAAYHGNQFENWNVHYSNLFDENIIKVYLAITNHIGTMCMTFFFFMSGFWFYQNIKSLDDLYKKCKKRLKTLFIPYWLWSIVFLLFTYGFFAQIFIQPFLKLGDPIDGPLWYLLALLLLTIISPLLFLLREINKHLPFLIILLVIFYLILRNFDVLPRCFSFQNWWWYENMLYYTPCYLIGACIGLYKKDLLLEKDYKGIRFVILGTILMILPISLMIFNIVTKLSFGYFLVELFGSWLILYVYGK